MVRVRLPIAVVGAGLVAGALTAALTAGGLLGDPPPAAAAAPTTPGPATAPAAEPTPGATAHETTAATEPSASGSAGPEPEPTSEPERPKNAIRATPEHLLGDLVAALEAEQTYAFRLRTDPETPPFDGVARLVEGRADIAATIDEGAAVSEIRLVGDDLYASIPGLTDGWGRAARDVPSDPFTFVYAEYLAVADLPVLLGGAQSGVRGVTLADAPVDGLEATVYDVEVDARMATGPLHLDETDASENDLEAIIVMRFWVDDDGLVRRLGAPGEEGHVDFFDHGEPVTIEAPAESTPIEYLG